MWIRLLRVILNILFFPTLPLLVAIHAVLYISWDKNLIGGVVNFILENSDTIEL